MLVLTRKEGEAIVIDESTVIRVLSFRNGAVRIGIDADKTVLIRRDEIKPKNNN